MHNDTSTVEPHSIASQRPDYDPLIRLWMLRLLVTTGAGARWARRGLENDEVALYLGYAPRGKGSKTREFNEWCEAALTRCEAHSPVLDGLLLTNIRTLSEVLRLSPVEEEIIAFKALSVANDVFGTFLVAGLGSISGNQLARVLANALGRPIAELDPVCRATSLLFRSGLMACNAGSQPLVTKVVARIGLIDGLFSTHQSLDSLIAFATRRAVSPEFRIDAFPHLCEESEDLRRYLASVRREGLAGVNILLYGEPGVGKTEYVKALAHDLGMRLYEVNMAGDEDEPLTARERMAAFSLNQRIFAQNRDVLLLFDEIEDVFPNPGQKPDGKGVDKAWFNRLLETNPVPTFWLSNRISQIDAAHRRRFDYVLEIKSPPRSVRRQILASRIKGQPVSDENLDRHAAHEHLTPALAEKAARVMKRLDLTDETRTARFLDRFVANHLEAQGARARVDYPAATDYRFEYLNTSVHIRELTSRLADVVQANLLLHGPPGSGKTAYVHELARCLDRPLLVRRSSDLQSMWVGETERNLAGMFREARAEGAVLLLDEADSFLQSRQWATRSWEVSQVNELLTQMECFDGLFVCATNFLDRLDTASLRRFGLKIKFDYLTPEQRLALFRVTAVQLGIAEPDELGVVRIKRVLAELINLTPGDFAAARTRMRLTAIRPDLDGLLEAVTEESTIKPDGQKRVIGFG